MEKLNADFYWLIKVFILTTVATVFPVKLLQAENHSVTSADDVSALIEEHKLAPGDVIVWADGTYIDQELELNGINGKPDAPITIRAATAGGVVLQGESQIRMNSQWWVVEGFHFQGTADRASAYNAIQFRGSGDIGAEHVRLTNCAFTSLDNRENTAKWVQIYGRFNQVDHCHFTGKPNKGALLTIELDALGPDQSAQHIIEWNYFADVTRNKGSDNETIRIGFSGDQSKPAKCTVRYNLFERCNGESEVVSNKSSDNTYAHNTFRGCNGSLVLRHGHHATVRGNYFFGDGADDAGGIRINDSHHAIFNNYMQDLTGLTWNAAISIEGGKKRSGGSDSGYQAVDHVQIVHNTLVNCSKSVFLNKQHGKRGPTGVFCSNLIYLDASKHTPLFDIELPTAGIEWGGNLCSGGSVGTQIVEATAGLKLNFVGGLWRPNSDGPAAGAAVKIFPAVATDIEGTARPMDHRDIGAIKVSATLSVNPGSANVRRPLHKSDVGTNFLKLLQRRKAAVLQPAAGSGARSKSE